MTMQARETFFHAGGQETGGTERPDDDPLVAQFPMFYEQLEPDEPVRRGPGRPPGVKNKPKATEETP